MKRIHIDPVPMELEEMRNRLWRTRGRNDLLIHEWLVDIFFDPPAGLSRSDRFIGELIDVIDYGSEALAVASPALKRRYDLFVRERLEDEQWLLEQWSAGVDAVRDMEDGS